MQTTLPITAAIVPEYKFKEIQKSLDTTETWLLLKLLDNSRGKKNKTFEWKTILGYFYS